MMMMKIEWFEYFGALARTSEGRVLPFLGPYVNYVQVISESGVPCYGFKNDPLIDPFKMFFFKIFVPSKKFLTR